MEQATSNKPRWWKMMTLWAATTLACLALVADQTLVIGQEKAKEKKKAKAKSDLVIPIRKRVEDAKPVPQPVKIALTGQKLSSAELAKLIDKHIGIRQKSESVTPAAIADDAEFMRRAYLDLVGVIPTLAQTNAFLNSTNPNKRQQLVDDLLADPRFGRYVGEVWSGLMLPRESNNRALNHTPMKNWLAEHFNKNTPMNELVSKLVTAEGSLDENGAVTYFVANPTVDKITDNVTRMFLGVQLQCAQCHNHPFTDYKQNEYWGMAAFFMKVRMSANPQQAAKKGVSIKVSESAVAKGKKQMLPESAKIVPAKFLQGDTASIPTGSPARPTLAAWMTSTDNRFFAKAMVNRFWYQMFGRGLVNPVDDMHDDNEVEHPELLAELTNQFKLNGFDAKHLIRGITMSQAYQRSSKISGEPADPDLYAHRAMKVLAPEQLYDSLAAVLGNGEIRTKAPKGLVAPKKGGVGNRDAFLAFFRVEEANPLEYQSGIPQALRLMNSPQSNATAPAVVRAMEDAKQPQRVIENLYLMALNRRPTSEETLRMVQHVEKNSANGIRTAYGDVLWALMNSSEFVLNH